MASRGQRTFATVLALLTIAAYFAVRFRDSLLTFFFLDDFWCLNAAAHVQIESWRDVTQLLRPSHVGFLLYRPLTQVGYFYLLRQFFGHDASGYHAFQLLMHVVNAGLVFALAWALCGSMLAALAVGIIYAAAPGHGAAVYWIAAFTMTGTAFIVFSMLCIWQYTESAWRGLACTVLQGLGLLASEHACAAPALLALFALFSDRRQPWRRVVRHLAGPFGLVAVYLTVKLYWLHTGRMWIVDAYKPTFDPHGWLLRLGRYAVACFNGLTLLAFDDRRLRVVGVVVVLLVLVAGWRTLGGHRRWRLLALGGAMFVTSLLPVLPLGNHYFDYYIGVAALGAAVAVLGVCQLASRHWRWLVSAAAASLVLIDMRTGGSALRSSEWVRVVMNGAHGSAQWLQSVEQLSAQRGKSVTEILVPQNLLTESLFMDDARAETIFYPGTPHVSPYDPRQPPPPASNEAILARPSRLTQPLPGWDQRFDWLRRLAAGSQ